MKQLEIKQVFNRSLEIYKKNLGILTGIWAVTIICMMLSAVVPYGLGVLLVGPLVIAGALSGTSRVLDGESGVDISVLFSKKDKYLDCLVAGGSAMFLCTLIGIVLESVLGVLGYILSAVLGAFTSFIVPYLYLLIVEKSYSAQSALKRLLVIAQQYKIQICLMVFVSLVINLIGVFLFFVGLFISVPLTLVMYTDFFRNIEE